MDRDVERLVEATGVSVPLAARMVSLVLDSGASHTEVKAALRIVEAVLVTIPVSYQAEDLAAPAPPPA